MGLRIGVAVEGSYAAALYRAAGIGRVDLDIREKDKLRMIRKLDIPGMCEFMRVTAGDDPVSRHAVLALMHKVRVQRMYRKMFTDGQQRISRRWLTDHGYSTKLQDKKLNDVQRKNP